MLNEECCKNLKIPQSLCPFMFRKLTSFISNYIYDFGPKLLEFLGVNTKFCAPGWGLKHAYEEDLNSRQRILGQLSYQINYRENMYGHEPSERGKKSSKIILIWKKNKMNGI